MSHYIINPFPNEQELAENRKQMCKVCNRKCVPTKSAHPADVLREPSKYCHNCWMPLLEAEDDQ